MWFFTHVTHLIYVNEMDTRYLHQGCIITHTHTHRSHRCQYYPNGPLIRYVKLRVDHAPGIRGTFPSRRVVVIPTCITLCAWRTCHDAYQDRYLAVSFGVGGRESVPGIPGVWANRNFSYLVRGPWHRGPSGSATRHTATVHPEDLGWQI